MTKRIIKWDQKIRLYWKNYLLQSLLASLSVFMLLWLLHMQNLIVVASIGATAFVVFTMPQDVTAKPRNVVGGHLVGFACGSLCALIPHQTLTFSAMVYSLAVGSSILIMVTIDTEHPPAAGTALGVVIAGFSTAMMFSIVASILMLAIIHHILKPYLKELI